MVGGARSITLYDPCTPSSDLYLSGGVGMDKEVGVHWLEVIIHLGINKNTMLRKLRLWKVWVGCSLRVRIVQVHNNNSKAVVLYCYISHMAGWSCRRNEVLKCKAGSQFIVRVASQLEVIIFFNRLRHVMMQGYSIPVSRRIRAHTKIMTWSCNATSIIQCEPSFRLKVNASLQVI